MWQKFKNMDAKQKVLIVGGGVLVLFFLIRAVAGGRSGGGSTTVTGAPAQDMNDVAQALNESLTNKLEGQSDSFSKAIDMLQNQIETNSGLQSDALNKALGSFADTQGAFNQQFTNALSGLANRPEVDYNAIFDNKFSGMQNALDGLSAMNASLSSQLAGLKTQTVSIASNPNPTTAGQYQGSSGNSVYNPSSTLTQSQLEQTKQQVTSSGTNAAANNYINNLTGASSSAAVQQAYNTVVSNQTAQQNAINAYKGTSTSTPGVAQASVAKVEVVKKK